MPNRFFGARIFMIPHEDPLYSFDFIPQLRGRGEAKILLGLPLPHPQPCPIILSKRTEEMPNHNRPAKPFPKGNQLHKSINAIGRKRLFATPRDLWQAAHRYFGYCVDNPLPWWQTKGGRLIKVYKMQPMSMAGLCLYIGIAHLKYYRKLADFTETVDRIIAVIYVHNYTAAAVGLLNGHMIGQSLRQCANTKTHNVDKAI